MVLGLVIDNCFNFASLVIEIEFHIIFGGHQLESLRVNLGASLHLDEGIMLEVKAIQVDFRHFLSCHVGHLEGVRSRLFNSPIMVSLICSTSHNCDVNYTLPRCRCRTLIVANEDVLELVGCKGNDSLLILVENIAIVAIWVEVRDEGCGVVARCKRLIMNDRLAKAKVMGHTLDHILIKSFIEQVKRLGTVGGPRNQLANHRVVIHRDLTTFLHSCVNPDILMRLRFLILGQEAD